MGSTDSVPIWVLAYRHGSRRAHTILGKPRCCLPNSPLLEKLFAEGNVSVKGTNASVLGPYLAGLALTVRGRGSKKVALLDVEHQTLSHYLQAESVYGVRVVQYWHTDSGNALFGLCRKELGGPLHKWSFSQQVVKSDGP